MTDKQRPTIVFYSDFDFLSSGYMNISINLCKGLAELGYTIKCVGLNYRGEEHRFPFSIIPANNLEEAYAIFNNLCLLHKPEVVITALDIPLQQMVLQRTRELKSQVGYKHIGITALENGPLVDEWALSLMLLDYTFFISELGKLEAQKIGMSRVDHIVIGIDTNIWKPLSKEEKSVVRKNLGYSDDDFIVLTVADNQERKNLLASFKAVAIASKTVKNLKHVLVTREHNPYGWKLRSLASSLGISDKVFIYERGMPAEQLRLMYGISDVFLLLSKGEGFGMPILEAMACGTCVVATDTGAIHELLSEGRGNLVRPEYSLDMDTWGNSKRDFADPKIAATCLVSLCASGRSYNKRALKYAQSRVWDKPVEQLHSVIMELTNGKN